MSRESTLTGFQLQEPSLPSHRVSVAIAATLSLSATSFLLTYVIVLFILSNLNTTTTHNVNLLNYQARANITKNQYNTQTGSTSWLRSWARHRLSFIKTPFGIMFLNLVLADFFQALGFGMNYFWVANLDCHTTTCQTTCTIQGVLIQLGDVASAFSNLMIAIQTFLILTFSWHLPNWIAWASLTLIWIPVFVLGLAAPTIMGNWSGPNPFYTWSGDWCWISAQFSPMRLFLHYLWIFISAFASIALYGHLFLRLQIHFRRSKAHHGLRLTGDKGKNGTIPTDLVDGPVIPLQGDHLRKKLERKARAMLMYPIAFIFMILPLSAYRLASLAGHEWGITAATICGSMYCLSGFIDVLLFGTTRSILSVPVFSLKLRDRGGTAAVRTTGFGMSSSGLNLGTTRSAAFRVEVVQETVIDLDEPMHAERKNYPDETNNNAPDSSSNLALNSNSLAQNQTVTTNDSNCLTNPLLQPIRLSSTTIANPDSDLEIRYAGPSVFPSNQSHPLIPTDPTPWYEPKKELMSMK